MKTLIPVLALGSLFLVTVRAQDQAAAQPATPPAQPATTAPAAGESPPVPIDAALAKKGDDVYKRYCISCHGPHGDGRGYSAESLEPRPRDFTSGIFKCRSTPTGTLPTNDDLLRTIRVGIYHAFMPPWEVLGNANLRAVIERVKTFSPRWKEEGPGTPIVIPDEPPDDDASRARGKIVWSNNQCEKCHGAQGKGNGPTVPTLLDDWGFKIVPFDFTSSPNRKCGNTPGDLYRTFMTGVNGTPMPSYADSMKPAEAWDLVHYLQTLQQLD